MDGLTVGVASIQHSGTHLIYHMLTKCLKCKGVSIPAAREGNPGVFLFHLVDAHKSDFDMRPLITPMRHPVRIWESHRRRGKPFSLVEEQFRNLERLTYRPTFIHVDRVDRDEYVKTAGKVLGIHLETDWPLLSPKNTLGHKVTPERLEEIPKWIMEIYQATI